MMPCYRGKQNASTERCVQCGHEVYLPDDRRQPCLACRVRALPLPPRLPSRIESRPIELELDEAQEFRRVWLESEQHLAGERGPISKENAMSSQLTFWTPAIDATIDSGDLLWLDAGRCCRPASELPEGDPEIFARRFLGVAAGRSVPGNDSPIGVSVDAVHRFADPSENDYRGGELLAAAVGEDGQLLNQSLVPATNPEAAIATAWEDAHAPAYFQARVESTVLRSRFARRVSRVERPEIERPKAPDQRKDKAAAGRARRKH